MNYIKEITSLHKKGYVILRASRTTNAPIGWRRANGNKRWGYIEEMVDPELRVYKETFSASILSKSHCGFYLGHGGLCCIDLDTKKTSTTIEQTSKLKDDIIAALGAKVAVERTKSNGFHIYFKYAKQLPNQPDWTGITGQDGKTNNWIELYYSKRFIACYLSNSKKYTLEHGTILDLKELNDREHNKLMSFLLPFRGKEPKKAKTKKSSGPVEVDKETWDEAENYVAQLEAKQIDITGDNPQWFKIGKAFAHTFGAKGFDMFNRVSQFSPTYNADTIESDYTRFVEDDSRHNGTPATIASFFQICSEAELLDLNTLQTLQLSPREETVKEFEVKISKKDSMAVKTHAVVTEFVKHIPICCVDNAVFYIFQNTHWVEASTRFINELLQDFISRSTIDAKYRKDFHTVPYIELMMKELKLVTYRKTLEPHTGNLHDGIFINMENGILHIDMKSGKRKLLDHDQSYNFTTISPFCYDAAVGCPRFEEWLNKQIPDQSQHVAYYAFVASCLTRHKADIIMLLAGETSTGKSSLIDITRRVVGLENSVAISAGILFGGQAEAQTQAMQMENKLLAYDFDAQPFKHLEMLLKVAAQEPLPGWQMHVARRAVVNYGRMIIAMNPHNYSVFNAAVARRFITINMDIPVVKDNTVMPAIYENELAGIFNNVLNIGIKHLIENGGQIKQTEILKKQTLSFHMKARDPIRWFDEHYVKLTPSTDKSNKATAEAKLTAANPDIQILFKDTTSMYQEFRVWLEDVEGYQPNKIPLRKHFAADLKMYGVSDEIYKIDGILRNGVYIGKKGVVVLSTSRRKK